MKTLSEETKKKIAIAHKGVKRPYFLKENNPAWKGEKATYFSKHIWLFDNFGKASMCENRGCKYPKRNKNRQWIAKPKRFEWALIKGKEHDHKRENYWMLCVSCHRKYDYTEKMRERASELRKLGITGVKLLTN